MHVTLSIIFPFWALIPASLKCAEAEGGSVHLIRRGMGQEEGCRSE